MTPIARALTLPWAGLMATALGTDYDALSMWQFGLLPLVFSAASNRRTTKDSTTLITNLYTLHQKSRSNITLSSLAD